MWRNYYKMDKRLIKSFVLNQDISHSRKGDVIELRKYQAMVPLTQEELYFENPKNNHTFTFGFLITVAQPHSCFKNLKEKCNYFI